jgi:hypothetical protein
MWKGIGLVVVVIVATPIAYRFSRWMVVQRMKRGNLR